MTRLDEIKELFVFNTWAARRMFDATSHLSGEELGRDLKNSFPSVRDTLVHIVGAEWVWLSRWRGTSPTAIPNTHANLNHDQIIAWWEEINNDRESLLVNLTEDALDRTIEYTSFAGVHYAFPFWQMMRHQVNHSSYHRGQVMTMIKQLGHKPVSTDMILMYQERAGRT